jgi:flagellar motor switch/type III secretory pathway protein FliN
MKPQPLLFLGDTRRAAVTARIEAGSRRWRQLWSPGSDEAFHATCEPPAAQGFSEHVASAATSCWALESGDERLAVLLLPHATFAWMVHDGVVQPMNTSAMTAADSASVTSIAETLELDVAQSLLTELCAPVAREPMRVTRLAPDALQDWSRAARAWTLQVTATAGRDFRMLMSAARVEMLAPARDMPAASRLAALRDAIGENTVTLRAEVGETQLSLTELSDLALDDVLVLDQHLAEPVTLVSPLSGAPVAAGNLGRAGARRAVKVAGLPAQRN